MYTKRMYCTKCGVFVLEAVLPVEGGAGVLCAKHERKRRAQEEAIRKQIKLSPQTARLLVE